MTNMGQTRSLEMDLLPRDPVLAEIVWRLVKAYQPERAEDPTQFAWVFRHPGEPEVPPRQEAEKALALAREVYDPILARLPEEVQP